MSSIDKPIQTFETFSIFEIRLEPKMVDLSLRACPIDIDTTDVNRRGLPAGLLEALGDNKTTSNHEYSYISGIEAGLAHKSGLRVGDILVRRRNYTSMSSPSAKKWRFSPIADSDLWLPRTLFVARKHVERVDEAWYRQFVALRIFYNAHNHLEVPFFPKHMVDLADWTVDQWRSFRNLSQEQRQLLEQLGFEEETAKDKTRRVWREHYRLLAAIHQELAPEEFTVPLSYGRGHLMLGQWVDTQRINFEENRLSKEEITMLEEINFDFTMLDWSDVWDEKYELLKQFYESNGHTLVPQRYGEGDNELGNFAYKQRLLYKWNKLPLDRVRKMRDVDFVFDVRGGLNALSWDDKFRLLSDYHRKHGHVNLQGHECPGGVMLGEFVQILRRQYKRRNLRSDQVAKLESIGLVLDCEATPSKAKKRGAHRSSHSLAWNEKYQALLDYKETFGNTDVPALYVHWNATEREVNLGRWVHHQREHFKGKKLSKERFDKLRAIGFSFGKNADVTHYEVEVTNSKEYSDADDASDETSQVQAANASSKRERESRAWMEKFGALAAFHEEFGHVEVPATLVYNGVTLGNWVRSQRRAYKRGKLSHTREEKLKELGFKWKICESELTHSERWNNKLNVLKAYKEKYGHTCVPQNHIEDGVALGQWVNQQRRSFARNQLPSERKMQLDELGFAWRAKGVSALQLSQTKGADDSDSDGYSDDESYEESPEKDDAKTETLPGVTVGSRVEIWWDEEQDYFAGTVLQIDEYSDRFIVAYDKDNSHEWVDLKKQKFRPLQPASSFKGVIGPVEATEDGEAAQEPTPKRLKLSVDATEEEASPPQLPLDLSHEIEEVAV